MPETTPSMPVPEPVLPSGYLLLASPVCLDVEAGRWLARVDRPDYTSGPGLLVYVDRRPLYFMSGAELAIFQSYSAPHQPCEDPLTLLLRMAGFEEEPS
jgi:hypothetical protein